MSDARWKRHERRTAEAFDGARLPRTGRTGRDVSTEGGAYSWLCIECKDRARLPDYLHKGMAQAVADAGPDELPVVVLHQRGMRAESDYVCLRRADFVEWFGD